LNFVPNTNKIIWVANVEPSYPIDKMNLPEIDYNPGPENIITRIAISKSKKHLVFGNADGEILIFKR